MNYYKKENGFSIVDLMVAMAIIGVFSAVSIPHLKQWSRSYNLQSASIDLYAHMQAAKLGSVKENKSWRIHFNPGGLLGYEVRNSAGQPVKTVDFRVQYDGEIQYGDPTETKEYDASSLAFNANGLSDKGYAYISNKSRSKYYRIGMLSNTGSIKIEKWNGSGWE